ncbi:hypothetical protein [Cupriavidus sp. AcVe19-6a]|uniref:hypothetical protein n=1 Tax=Cupriavidus sp. AcVe19-6a TaxID=2821358 RepID=UPI001AE54179|nr:hypothetical protein [Cupriavidus sp. AcVe19-6a]MBP0634912.1 hypothetical protein [Cupriavidus sp. AcVe19-6a]
MATLELKNAGTVTNLEKWAVVALPEDLRTILRQVAVQEHQELESIKRAPTVVFVDSRESTFLDAASGAMRNWKFNLYDAADVERAVVAAYSALQAAVRARSGTARASIEVWGRYLEGGRHDVRISPASIGEFLRAHPGPGTYVRLLGPITPYRRAVFYSPVGADWVDLRTVDRTNQLVKEEAKMRKAMRKRGVKPPRRSHTRALVKQRQTIHATVKKALSPFKRNVYMSFRWITIPGAIPGQKGYSGAGANAVPAVAIGFKGRGL